MQTNPIQAPARMRNDSAAPLITIRNEYGIAEIVTLQEFIAMESAEVARLMEMAKHDPMK